MSKLRSLLSTGVFGIAVVVVQPSSAQPEGPKPRPPAAAQPPGQANAPGAPGAKAAGPAGQRGPKRADEGADERRGKGQAKRGDRGRDGDDRRAKDKGKRKNKQGHKKRVELQAKKDSGKPLTAEEKQEFDRLWNKRLDNVKKRRGPHFEAYLALLEKQKEGKLTDAENTKLEKLGDLRRRHRELDKREAKRSKTRRDRARKAKRNLLRRFPSLLEDETARAEFRKHAEREAMLSRALDVAQAEGLEDVMKRVELLRTKERARHGKWMQAHFDKAKQGDKK